LTMTVAKIPQRYQRVARASAARPRHPASAIAGVSVEIKHIGQAIDLTQFNGHYLTPIHGFDLRKLHRYRLLLCPQVVDSP
jgi:hypothetical protein